MIEKNFNIAHLKVQCELFTMCKYIHLCSEEDGLKINNIEHMQSYIIKLSYMSPSWPNEPNRQNFVEETHGYSRSNIG